MKDLFFALTCDQRSSRDDRDRVPDALHTTANLDYLLAPERTAGDEIQALTEQPATVVGCIEELTMLGDWRIGVGIGDVELPLPTSTREARGTAYIAARAAIDDARRAPHQLALRAGDAVQPPALLQAETALWLFRGLLENLTPAALQVLKFFDAGAGTAEVARSLAIAPSAVSQRMNRIDYLEVKRARQLCIGQLAQARDALARGEER